MEREDKVLSKSEQEKSSYSNVQNKLKKTGFTVPISNKGEYEFLRKIDPIKKISGTVSKSAKKVAGLVKNKKNIEEKNPYEIADTEGDLPIHKAAIHGFSKFTLDITSDKGRLIDKENIQHKTPLDLAIEYDNKKTAIDIIQLGGHCNLKSFIKLFANTNQSDNNSQTKNKEEEEKNRLQEETINQIFKPLFYTTCLQLLREFKFELVLEVLLEVSKNISLDFSVPNGEDLLPLHYLARGSYKEFLKSSKNTEVNAREQFSQLLRIVSNEGHLITTKTKNGKNALHFSAQYGELETAEQLLKLTSSKNLNLLLLAPFQEKENLSKLSPLDVAFIHGHKELAEKLYDLNKKALSPVIVFEMINNFMYSYSPLRGIEHDKYATTISAKDARKKRNQAILDCFDFLYKNDPSLFTKLRDNDNILHFAINVSENAEDLRPIFEWCESHNLQTLLNQKNHENKTLDEIAMKIYQQTLKQILTLPVSAEIEQQKQQPEITETPSSCTLS